MGLRGAGRLVVEREGCGVSARTGRGLERGLGCGRGRGWGWIWIWEWEWEWEWGGVGAGSMSSVGGEGSRE